jgi:formylglycine-generating enzyme required for sulfatase activity
VLIGTLAGVVLGGLAGWGLIVQGIEEDSGDERGSGALGTAVGGTTPPAPTPSPDCGDDMVLIDGGEFFMGSDSEAEALATARPVHQVRVGDFCLDKTEVTVDAYRACSQQGICRRAFRDSWWPRGNGDETEWKTDRDIHSRLCNERYDDRGTHPINCVSWHQAKAYCAQVGKALPTEEQWEFAARRMDGRVYSWGDSKPDSERMNGCGSECSAWRQAMGAKPTPPLYEADDGFPGSAPVGSFPAGNTKEGISDLAGNVFEWTDDEFRPYGEIAKLVEESPGRVIRGGAFNSYKPEFADPALRFPLAADAHSHGVGFRCAAKVR